MKEKKSILQKLSDISRIHHRAAFTDVAKHTTPKQSAFLKLAAERYSCRDFSPAAVSDEELAKRKAKWVAPEPKVKTGYLARYAKLVSSADKGAILQ